MIYQQNSLRNKYSDIFTTIIVKDFNKCMHNGTFPKSFKICEVIPAYRKDAPFHKNNYRPIGVFSNCPKFMRHICSDEINSYLDNILSKFQCGFGCCK